MTPGAPGLYVHVPFCSAICPYCDFAVTVGKRATREKFVRALLREIDHIEEHGLLETGVLDAGGFDTVYFGGGTPSALEPEDLRTVLDALVQRLGVVPDPDVHLEVNPEDVETNVARAWLDLGVRFLSLGIQSMDDAELRFLGRRHRRADAMRAYETIRSTGFDTVSLDLIYGLPDQDARSWEDRVVEVAALRPDHVSCYQLTVHEGTAFARFRDAGRLVEADEDRKGDFFAITHRVLGEHGLPAYEVSNFAGSDEHRSRHNRKYWFGNAYLGIGPSAHSFDGRRRWWNHRDLAAWQARIDADSSPVLESEELEPADVALERVMLGLRTREGIDLDEIERRCGLDLEPANRELASRFAEQGYLRIEGRRWIPTLDGWAIADALAREFEIR